VSQRRRLLKSTQKKSGHPCKFTTHDVCIAARMLASTRAHDVTDLQRQHFPNLHADMIQKRLTKCGLKAYIRHTKPFLSDVHKKQWLEWAESHAHWTVADWKSVIFSDESKFNLFRSDGRRWCWRKPGEEFDKRYVRKEVKHGGGNVMVWGCVTTIGMGHIVKINGNMDGPLYTEILKDDVCTRDSEGPWHQEKIYTSSKITIQSTPPRLHRNGSRRTSLMCWTGHQAALT
jgi:hypothetical protein